MCYAAMARADLAECLREYDAFLDADMFERLFWERVNNPRAGIRFPLAIDRYFMQARNVGERKVKAAIEAYRAIKIPEWELEIFKQRKRYADAERALKTKHTSGPRHFIEEGRATQGLAGRHEDLRELSRVTLG